ncbi:hypothetical protein LPB72_20925 [Hydrogenophaga crassostreae]|uniref:Chalcone isomerase domain-containing protein n=1 Tax=Hydrogenophaga crassostreae TaxID=1763535 RepID=A0A167GHC3_9BURK|nr:chalcone isomerase family protein [Hydrogenophaga crassostreae]AOW15008.1 hypothetical protein LPB072_21540 [Hydrogenophaga crassostreae]OAD39461.1 hypothetical protein LPB72_20925 [Hydrogenophaga crassostreae]
MTSANDTTSPSANRSSLPRWALALSFTVAAFLAAPQAIASERDLAGVKVVQSLNLAGQALALNGAGIRYRGPFKVYTAALYTTNQVGSPAEFHADKGNKRLVLTMLREIKSSQMGRLFIKGVQKNLSPGDLGSVISELPRMGEIFSANKRMLPGEQLVIDWVPGRGMQISARGEPQGEPFESQAFFEALMNIWLGQSPADWRLKDALLGIEAHNAMNTL